MAAVAPPLGAANLVATLFRWALAWTVFASAGILILLAAPFTTPRRLFPLTSRMLGVFSRLAGVRAQVTGLEHLKPGTGYVFLLNHVSVLDNFVFASVVPEFIVGLEKSSNFKVPVYGWVTRWWGNIPVVREDKEKARGAIVAAKARLLEGTSIALAPEGTRSTTGGLLPFKKGGFHLAKDTGASIVPVALLGMRDRNPDRKFRLVPGPVEIRFHAPITPAAGEPVDALVARVRAVFHASGIPDADAAPAAD